MTDMEKTVRKVSLHDQPSDAAYWRQQPPEERLAALEQIRREYHGWTDDTQPRLQRVYSVAKRE
jgi:hypothetical protein